MPLKRKSPKRKSPRRITMSKKSLVRRKSVRLSGGDNDWWGSHMTYQEIKDTSKIFLDSNPTARCVYWAKGGEFCPLSITGKHDYFPFGGRELACKNGCGCVVNRTD